MKIETKFDIGQKVFFIYKGNIGHGKVDSIAIKKYGIVYYIKYFDEDIFRNQKEIFASPTEAAQHWIHKQEIELFKQGINSKL